MQDESQIRPRWELVREHLNERQRRVLAAAEAKVIGRGGVTQVAAATGPEVVKVVVAGRV